MTHLLYALVAQCDVKCHALVHMEVPHNLQGSRIQGWHWGCYNEVITVQVLGIVKTSGCASTIEEGPGLWAESLNTTPGKSKASVGCCPKSHKSHQCRSPAWRRWLAIGPVTSSSSALRLAKSSAGGILSFAVGRS